MSDTDSICTLNADEAKRLIKSAGDSLSLNGLTSLDLPTAEVLALYRGQLYLDGLTELSEEVARALALHEWGCLRLNGLKCLTPDVADALARHRRHLLLNGLESITDEVAESLGKRRCALSLDGVNTLTVRAARGLAQPMGWPKRLDGQETRPDYAEKLLGRTRGKALSLQSLASVLADVEKALTLHSGDLNLSCLSTLQTSEMARKYMAGEARIAGVRHLTATAAKGLGPADTTRDENRAIFENRAADNEDNDPYMPGKQNVDVHLMALETLEVDVASALAEVVKGELSLCGVRELSDEVAAALIAFDGHSLDLRGLDSLSLVTCETLATLRCDLWLGVTRLDSNQSQLLARKQGRLYLPRLQALSDEDLAQKLIEDGDSDACVLGGLCVFPDAVAEILVMAVGSLSLGNVAILTPRAAKAFSGYNRGSLELPLDNLSELTDECAELLSHYKGCSEHSRLFLGRPYKLSARAESLLRANRRVLLDTPEEKAARLRHWAGNGA